MIEVADVVRQFGSAYLDAHGASVLPSHRRALADILACHTEVLGGLLWRCTACSAKVPSYHGCRNRSCPKCHRDQTKDWFEARSDELLPTHHFHVTVTIPAELRDVFRRHQQVCYGVLMGASAAAIKELALDPRYVGGLVGVLAVLHTWTRQLWFHPHVHCLVTGGGVSPDGRHWHPNARDGFLVPVKALAKLIRGKVRAALAKALPHVDIPVEVWRKAWVVHCVPWGEGEDAVLAYLARYVHRTAITNSRILAMDSETVTFQYKARNGDAGEWRSCTVSGHEFLRRFCQHILPRGFHKVRYYGLWHPSKRAVVARVRQMLLLERRATIIVDGPDGWTPDGEDAADSAPEVNAGAPGRCPTCGKTAFVFLGRIFRYRDDAHAPAESPDTS